MINLTKARKGVSTSILTNNGGGPCGSQRDREKTLSSIATKLKHPKQCLPTGPRAIKFQISLESNRTVPLSIKNGSYESRTAFAYQTSTQNFEIMKTNAKYGHNMHDGACNSTIRPTWASIACGRMPCAMRTCSTHCPLIMSRQMLVKPLHVLVTCAVCWTNDARCADNNLVHDLVQKP